MIDKHHYKSISKKEKYSRVVIENHKTFQDFLALIAKRKEYYEIKFIETYEDGYKFVTHYIEGEFQEPEGLEKIPVPKMPNIDVNDLFNDFKKFAEAAPNRRENPIELLFDSMRGEDLTKAKVKVLKGGKE